MLTGGCFCGKVRYETTGQPLDQTNCHCSICQRTTGAPFVSWFSVPLSSFRLVAGQPTQFNSTENGTRSFCATCGTQLLFAEQGKDEIDITIASLDNPEDVSPDDHIYVGSRISWVSLSDDLPQYINSRSAKET